MTPGLTVIGWRQSSRGGQLGDRLRRVTHLLGDQQHQLLQTIEPLLQVLQGGTTAFATGFEAEYKLRRQAHARAAEMLPKLNDFLSVPASIRLILNFHFYQLLAPQRFSDLEQSFSEVVLLNDAFRQLSEERLA